MLPKLLLAIVVVALVWALMAHYRKQKPSVQKKLAVRYGIYAIVGLVVILALTGHLHWISAAVTALVAAVVRFLPVAARAAPLIFHFAQQQQNKKTSSGNNSTVQSEYLKIVLDHDTETMRGEIIKGLHSGEKLEQLNKIQLRELLQYYDQRDQDSFELLKAFLQRQHPDESWQSESTGERQQQISTAMNRKEALEILGLQDSASDKDIKLAHKQLMQRLHPDRGGSSYLAAKVNEAKAYLLKKL